MAPGLSNCHMTIDLTWPWKVKVVAQIYLDANISKSVRDSTGERRFLWTCGYYSCQNATFQPKKTDMAKGSIVSGLELSGHAKC